MPKNKKGANGNNQHTERVGTKFPPKTQSELADETGMTVRQLHKYKSLADLIPELQDAVQSGQITATTAMGFVKKLSPEEQKKPHRPNSRQKKRLKNTLKTK